VAWANYQAQLAQAGITGDAALASTARVLNTQALTLGANDIFFMMACLFVLLIPLVWLARPPFHAVGTSGAH
jgi:DHA2 family multidrug resistance protein